MKLYKIALRGNLECSALRAVGQAFIDDCTEKPELVVIDFTALTFVRPAGVTFLSNFVSWLKFNGIEVRFERERFSAPIEYLDNSLFFKLHVGEKIRSS
jgi:hypothetical protein